MDALPAAKKKWELTGEAFDKLLASLDANRDRAAERYELIRQKLTTFFEHRGCQNAAEHTDDVFNRVARRLDEGATIYANKPESYFYAVARNVLKEYWEKPQPAELDLIEEPQQDPLDGAREREKEIEKDQLFECQKECVQWLARDLRDLAIQYYQDEPGTKMKKKREQLARQLGMTPNALRIKACRIRDKLEDCVLDCLRR